MRSFASLVLLIGGWSTAQTAPPSTYWPPRAEWQQRKPEDLGLAPDAVAAAVRIASEGETKAPRNGVRFLEQSFGNEPHHEPIGPVFDRGGACGVVVYRGYLVAQWGDVARADMCNSVTKTFLTTVVGLAWQRGSIRDVHDRVGAYMPRDVDLFASEHDAPITWEHLLRQTSDWQGELWGKPDWADRPEGASPEDWPRVPRHAPGERFEYNDVRVNVLALAALHVWRRPLPAVLRDEVMEPIGASSTWRWYGYDNSWIELDGARVQSVSGGGHWGGGIVIDALDLARFGLLFARDGRWAERQIVDPRWIAMARTPGERNAGYGYANWYLNVDQKALPAAPASAVRFVGNGVNIVFVDRERDLVAVLRWISGDGVLRDFVAKLYGAFASPAAK
jgi:CubicO group peptidase (beta-lactamase class C family)